ncbi:hypothetical protein ON010_g7131 [Phytophthora cinnamomi]|nr:hypothetical protein ON010_g7131 [Phytophthora cinnamomi]
MSAIPDYGGAIPKRYKSESVGDIKELGIKKQFRMVILGPSFSGKKNLVFHILKHAPHVFSYLHVIARNPHQELYDYLKDKLEGFVSFHETPPNVDAIRRTPGNKPELVIIDDYSNDKSLQKNVFSQYFARGRHHKRSTIFLSHSWFATHKMIRLNTEHFALLQSAVERGKGQMLFFDSVKGQIRSIMSSFVKIDNTCLVQNGLNNTWRYQFPGSACNFKDVEASVQSICLYNSDFNIDSAHFANTSFAIEVPTAATTTTLSVNLQDGYYLYSDINCNIQTALITAGAYLIDSNGNNIFYIQIEENSTYYASATYPSSPQTTSTNLMSNTISAISPSTSYVVHCDLIKNDFVITGDIMAVFDKGDAGIGKKIQYFPSHETWCQTHDGPRTTITLSIWN